MAFRALWCCLLALALTATGCRPPKPSSAEVRVGLLIPATGDLADAGGAILNGATLAMEEINSGGGIASLKGAKLRLVLGDTKGVPEVGANEALRLIREDKVALLVGGYQSSTTLMMTAVAEGGKTPFVVSTAIADVISERGFRYTFRLCPKATTYGRDQVQFLLDLGRRTGRPIRRAALVHESTGFGTAVALAQKRAAKEMGLQVVAERSYPAQHPEYAEAAVRAVLALKPDAILTASYLEDVVAVRRAMAQVGATLPLVDAGGGMASIKYKERLGSQAEGSFTLSEYSELAPGRGALGKRYRARFGVGITGDGAYAYESLMVIRDALERAKSADREALRDALAATDMNPGPGMVLPAKRLRFGPDGQSYDAQLLVLQLQSGAWVPVWPPEFAAAKPRLTR